MRIYQVLVIGSFVALAACTGDDNASDSALPPEAAAPANDVAEVYPREAEPADAEGGPDLPDGAVDPVRPLPTP